MAYVRRRSYDSSVEFINGVHAIYSADIIETWRVLLFVYDRKTIYLLKKLCSSSSTASTGDFESHHALFILWLFSTKEDTLHLELVLQCFNSLHLDECSTTEDTLRVKAVIDDNNNMYTIAKIMSCWLTLNYFIKCVLKSSRSMTVNGILGKFDNNDCGLIRWLYMASDYSFHVCSPNVVGLRYVMPINKRIFD